jgi:hypothetical protein
MYHCDALGDIYKVSDIIDREAKGNAADNQQEKESLFEQFTFIGQKLNYIINWMLNKIDGQREFNWAIEEVLTNAQVILDKKIDERIEQLEA